MIGSYFKKLAKENGMNIKSGVAYGSFKGYAVTFRDGNNTKFIDIATRFPSLDEKFEFMAELGRIDLMKQYRVREIHYYDNYIEVIFYDTLGTWKKLLQFVDYFFPLLGKYGATGADICTECGNFLGFDSTWKLVDNVAYRLHGSCAESVRMHIERENQMAKENVEGSYLKGAVGALIGALIGAIPWAILLYFGYFAALMGVVIGLLAAIGYKKCGGKDGGAKGIIIILCSILGVIVGTFGADVIYLVISIKNGQLSPLGYKDIVPAIVYLLTNRAEYRTSTLANIGIGLVFAFVGIFSLRRGMNLGKKSKSKILNLE